MSAGVMQGLCQECLCEDVDSTHTRTHTHTPNRAERRVSPGRVKEVHSASILSYDDDIMR